MPKKRLPIGIQTFREIREDGCYYVDKTGFALRLIEQGKAFFLSRPRRFGKSLFIDTLAELFAGNEPLFRGLEAHDRWDWERRFPVVRLSFAEGVLHSRSELDEKATELLAENERRLGVSGDAPSLSGRFSQLLRLAEERHGERVVVLVDEYDKPILDNLSDPDIARACCCFKNASSVPGGSRPQRQPSSSNSCASGRHGCRTWDRWRPTPNSCSPSMSIESPRGQIPGRRSADPPHRGRIQPREAHPGRFRGGKWRIAIAVDALRLSTLPAANDKLRNILSQPVESDTEFQCTIDSSHS